MPLRPARHSDVRVHLRGTSGTDNRTRFARTLSRTSELNRGHAASLTAGRNGLDVQRTAELIEAAIAGTRPAAEPRGSPCRGPCGGGESTRLHSGLAVQPRYIARVALFLALTVVGFIIARVLADAIATRLRPSRRGRGGRSMAASPSRIPYREPAPVHAGCQEYRRHERPIREERTEVAGPGALLGRRMGRAGSRFAACGVRATYREAIGRPTRATGWCPSDRAPPICRRRWPLAFLRWPCPGSI